MWTDVFIRPESRRCGEKAQKEVENMIREEGEAAYSSVGVHGIQLELVRLLGRMEVPYQLCIRTR